MAWSVSISPLMPMLPTAQFTPPVGIHTDVGEIVHMKDPESDSVSTISSHADGPESDADAEVRPLFALSLSGEAMTALHGSDTEPEEEWDTALIL